MKLIVFATLMEAEETIRILKAKTTSDPECFLWDGGKIVISGWGCYYAMMAVCKHVGMAEEVINMGIAASLKKFSVGEVVQVKSVAKYSVEPFSKSLPVIDVAEGFQLVSSDFPIHTKEHREKLQDYDLLDMEGYGIAFAAKHLKKKVKIVKVVSDYASGQELIKKNMKLCSEVMAKEALGFLDS